MKRHPLAVAIFALVALLGLGVLGLAVSRHQPLVPLPPTHTDVAAPSSTTSATANVVTTSASVAPTATSSSVSTRPSPKSVAPVTVTTTVTKSATATVRTAPNARSQPAVKVEVCEMTGRDSATMTVAVVNPAGGPYRLLMIVSGKEASFPQSSASTRYTFTATGVKAADCSYAIN